jgi:hypothetical protein
VSDFVKLPIKPVSNNRERLFFLFFFLGETG